MKSDLQQISFSVTSPTIPHRKAVFLVIGANGQIGSYLCENLCKKFPGSLVFGTYRNNSDYNLKCAKEYPNFHPVRMDTLIGIGRTIYTIVPDCIINLAAIPTDEECLKKPEYAVITNVSLVREICLSIDRYCRNCIFINAGSTSEFEAGSYYGTLKRRAREVIDIFRIDMGLKAYQPYVSLHDSERGKDNVFSRKTKKRIQEIGVSISKREPFEPISLFNINERRFWGHANEASLKFIKLYERIKFNMVNLEKIAIFGRPKSIKKFVEEAFIENNISYSFNTNGTYTAKTESGDFLLAKCEEVDARKDEVSRVNPYEFYLL